jgi:hypothetical protein
MKRLRYLQPILAFLLTAAGMAQAACNKDPECDSIERWALRFPAITLSIGPADGPPTATWRGRFDHKTNDIVVDVDVKGDTGALKGVVAMVGGRVMLTKDLKLERGYEIDALDAPMLSMILVMRLLDRVFPDGPSSVPAEKSIDRTDKVGIKVATPSADWRIAGPWHLGGTAKKDAKGAIAYDLVLSYPQEGPDGRPGTQTMRLRGDLAGLDKPPLPDTMSLEGWVAYGVGVQQEKSEGATSYDYGAKRDEKARFKTVADVRAHIAAYARDELGPGTLDATKDFTGFWKDKCEENFGLKILHYGDEGKYAVLFCGPGGCDDVKQARLTYITGDKLYTVVGEDQLLLGRGADKSHYRRCSKEVGSIATP